MKLVMLYNYPHAFTDLSEAEYLKEAELDFDKEELDEIIFIDVKIGEIDNE